ncbi:MAG: sucrase ferredoxin, partial [Cyanobacteria bacterium J06659_2]
MTASPLTAACKFCSEVSKANGEDPIGSANPTDSWLVMELPLPWTEERFNHDPILQPIHDLFHEILAQG